jgi:hypothetical protein
LQFCWQQKLKLDLVSKGFQLFPRNPGPQGIKNWLCTYGSDSRFSSANGMFWRHSMLDEHWCKVFLSLCGKAICPLHRLRALKGLGQGLNELGAQVLVQLN